MPLLRFSPVLCVASDPVCPVLPFLVLQTTASQLYLHSVVLCPVLSTALQCPVPALPLPGLSPASLLPLPCLCPASALP